MVSDSFRLRLRQILITFRHRAPLPGSHRARACHMLGVQLRHQPVPRHRTHARRPRTCSPHPHRLCSRRASPQGPQGNGRGLEVTRHYRALQTQSAAPKPNKVLRISVYSRFTLKLFDDLALPWCEVTLVLTVAHTFESIMDATSLHWTCRFVTTIRKLLLYYQQGFVVMSTEVC